MPGLRADTIKRRRVELGFDQADVAALIPCDDGSGDPWPRALLSMVENRKAKIRGFTPLALRAFAALEHVRDHGCRASLGQCGRPHVDCGSIICEACEVRSEA